jgi:hypothetical protein
MRKFSRFFPTFLLGLVLLTSGCGGNYGRSVYGTEGGYSLKNAKAKPASLMIAHKIDRPLYIVLDPARVHDSFSIATAACATGAMGCEHFQLMDVQEFVRRDLKASLGEYFSRVEVVAPGQALPSTPHVVADVKVDDIKIHEAVRGAYTYAIIQMTWGFALRRSEKTEYSYSFAGTSESNDSYPTFEAGLGQLIENAIPSMLKKWTEGGGIEALRDGGSVASASERGDRR